MTLAPERIDALLAQFRGWLESLTTPIPAIPEPHPVDLSTVVAQFTALRHDVNLQTRATRTAIEQNAEILKQIPTTDSDSDESIRPLVKAIIDIADALATAVARLEKTRETVEPLLAELVGAALPSPPETSETPPRPGFFARIFASPPTSDLAWNRWADDVRRLEKERNSAASRATEMLRPIFAGLADGYAMSLRRVERVLPTFGVEAIECLGQSFDPELMEAVEMTDSPGQSAGTVVEELRRGYRWKGKLFRFAQVKVAR